MSKQRPNSFINKRGECKTYKGIPVEEQYDKEELERIQNAIRYTHAVFGNSAQRQYEDIMKNGMPTNE